MITEGRSIEKRIELFDMKISLEVLAGQKRTGTSKSGKKWEHAVSANYGYILGTNSPDGEHLDVWVKDGYDEKETNRRVYVMHQLTPDGSRYDEDKVMLGYDSKEEAIDDFKKHIFRPKMFGGMSEFDIEHFKVIAYQASNSTAMLATQKMYDHFVNNKLLPRGIKSPIKVSQIVKESLEYQIIKLSKINVPLMEMVVSENYMSVLYAWCRTVLKYPDADTDKITAKVANHFDYSIDFLIEVMYESFYLTPEETKKVMVLYFDYESFDRPQFDVFASNLKNKLVNAF